VFTKVKTRNYERKRKCGIPVFNMDVKLFLVDHSGKRSTTDASTAKCLGARKFFSKS
jgi:hypothetical protein